MQVLERILAVDYHFPSSIPVSEHCKDLLRHILVADPAKRFSIADIQRHPWCVLCLQCSEVLEALATVLLIMLFCACCRYMRLWQTHDAA